MIAKNKKGSSFGGCVRYVLNEDCEILEAQGVLAEDAASVTRDFTIQRSGRPEIKQPVGHIPISFSPKDSPRMTNGFMLQLAKEYMQEMGIKDTQYIVVRHNDTANPHIHIVYNRIDNDLKVISVNNDYKRNIKICKKLKDKYRLTYGKGKDRVNRPKLHGADKLKYEIHDTIKATLPKSVTFDDLKKLLKQGGIAIRFKYRSGAKESVDNIQGISFEKGGCSFKGSEIDQKYSYASLKKVLDANMHKMIKEIMQQDTGHQKTEPQTNHQNSVDHSAQEKHSQMASQKAKKPMGTPISELEKNPRNEEQQPEVVKKNPTIRGVELTEDQLQKLLDGDYIYLENMLDNSGNKFSYYVFTDLDLKRVFFSKHKPDSFIEYGKYTMRLMDKRRIEAGYLTHATVKWYGYGSYAHPYLWKRLGDNEYRESWSDPRKPKQKQEENQRQEQVITPKKIKE